MTLAKINKEEIYVFFFTLKYAVQTSLIVFLACIHGKFVKVRMVSL